MSDDFDPTPYVRPPKIDIPSGVALSVALLSAVPKPRPDHVDKAAKRLRKSVVGLQAAWAKSDIPATPADKRKADIRIDNAWGMLLDRLEAYASLPVQDFPKAARAREILEAISRDREWLKLPYGSEWAESQKRLARIDGGLAADVDALAGPEFLTEIRRAHEAYGIAIGVTQPIPQAESVNLAEHRRALSRAIASYGIAVVSMAGDDDEALATVRKALRPIDDYREAQSRRNASAAGDAPEPLPATPATPIPDPQ
ncbi:Hypothetical protein A7982_04995 [Minicystis rosea]|nr:Hypothetical protein A7982_04995 [Minicystis rosea]